MSRDASGGDVETSATVVAVISVRGFSQALDTLEDLPPMGGLRAVLLQLLLELVEFVLALTEGG